MKTKPKWTPVSDSARQAESAKIDRLRALRLAKEAADREAKEIADREAAAKPPKRRVRSAPVKNAPADAM